MPLPAGPVVGTCGFGYPEWRGRFYPPELAVTSLVSVYRCSPGLVPLFGVPRPRVGGLVLVSSALAT